MAEFDVDALRALLAQADAGQTEQQPAAEQQQQTQEQEQTPEAQPAEQQQQAEQQPVDQPDVHVATQDDKDANAFAQMRVANKQMSDMLAKIAQANGIQYSTQEEMIAKLNDDSVTKLAAAQGVPKELLLRMEGLERDAAAYRAQQNQNRLVSQMHNIMDKYNVSATELQAFATTLDNEHVDVNTVDLEREYFFRNQEAIMQKRINAAVEAALRGDAAAAQQSTTPLAQGANGGGTQGTRIETVADLRSVLANANI